MTISCCFPGLPVGVDQMLVEQVVDVDVAEHLRLQVLLDAVVLQLVLKHSHFHQEQSDHPFLH